LVVIISPEVAEEEVSDTLDKLVRHPIETRGGEVQEVNHWGRRKLAYPIQKHLEGNYVLTQFQIDPQQTKELEQGLLISEEVIRHLLIRLDERRVAPTAVTSESEADERS
jgi:small subunit ribosomal protein S6